MTQLPQRNPAEILEAQVKLLTEISQQQHELIDTLTEQLPGGPGYVKVVDFNMPFFALVGLLLKISIAAIPAAIVVGLLWILLSGLLIFFLSVLGIGLGTLIR